MAPPAVSASGEFAGEPRLYLRFACRSVLKALRPVPLAAVPAARHPAPFLSVLCGAGLLLPAASVLARLGVGSRWHGEAWTGCWEAAAGVCACKGALYFLYACYEVFE